MIVVRLIGWILFFRRCLGAGARSLGLDRHETLGADRPRPVVAQPQSIEPEPRSGGNRALRASFCLDPIMVSILLCWAFAVLIVLGVLILAVFSPSFPLHDFFKILISNDYDIENARLSSHVLGTPRCCRLLGKGIPLG
jgi:hypothetical protein